TGRFLTRDPFPGLTTRPATLHPYTYGLNNPVLYVDPTGEFAFLPLLAVAAAGGLLGGLGYYGIQAYLQADPCTGMQWDWNEALFWGGVGTVMGAAIGTGIYGGWWVGVQAGWWGAMASGGLAAQQVAQRAGSVWQLPPLQRGIAIHRMLSQNLPMNFPTIDRFVNGVATSIKTLDLSAPTYQNIAALTSKVQGYINVMASFQGAQWLQAQMITARELVLVIPSSAGTPAQWAALQALQQYAANLGVTLTTIPIP
ncbi:MAG: hypothetical protein ACETWR_11990, partial [Anaerolineae bacterium]